MHRLAVVFPLTFLALVALKANGQDKDVYTYEGTIHKVDVEKEALTIKNKVGGKIRDALKVSRIAQVTLNGNVAKLSDLKESDVVTIKVQEDKAGKGKEIIKIEAKRAP